jgi:hypothetical protein
MNDFQAQNEEVVAAIADAIKANAKASRKYVKQDSFGAAQACAAAVRDLAEALAALGIRLNL